MSSRLSSVFGVLGVLAGLALLMACEGPPEPDHDAPEGAGVRAEAFGQLPDGRTVTRYTLTSEAGLTVKLMDYGGIITHLYAPDRHGEHTNVVLGFDTLDDYLEQNPPYFGAVLGRYANRIADGRFELDGRVYRLPTNGGSHHLHGGERGFDKRLWQSEVVEDERGPAVLMKLVSEDGDQGYPGRLNVELRYVLAGRELIAEFRAETDRPTPVSLSQHSYFNLAGRGAITDHRLRINAERYTPVDGSLIPTGELAPVAGTPLDFTRAKPIGRDIDADHPQIRRAGGYDHNYVLDRADGEGRTLAARVTEPDSGRVLELWTEAPGLQFYSANFLDGSLSDGERRFDARHAFCLEPQQFPDAPNQPAFPDPILRHDEVYRTSLSFRFPPPKPK